MSCHWNWELKGMSRGQKVLAVIGMVLLGILAAIAFALVFGIIIRDLWNWLMPAIFGLGEITYWQAVGLFLLGKLLFGGFGHGGSGKSDKHEKSIEARIEKKLEATFGCSGHDAGYAGYWEAEGREAYERWKEAQRKD